jgi:hypothetical protein
LKSRSMASMSASLGMRAMKGRRPNLRCILCMAAAGCTRVQCGVRSERRAGTRGVGEGGGGAAADELVGVHGGCPLTEAHVMGAVG